MTDSKTKTSGNVKSMAEKRRDIITSKSKVNSAADFLQESDSQRRLKRARNTSHFINIHIRKLPPSVETLLWLPEILSYISDDLDEVITGINEEKKGTGRDE